MSKRYTTAHIEAARQLHAGGFSAYRIWKMMREQGHPIAQGTVLSWLDDEYRLRRNHVVVARDCKRRDVSGEVFRRRMVALAERGVGPAALSVIADVYHGRHITPVAASRMVRRGNDRDAVNA